MEVREIEVYFRFGDGVAAYSGGPQEDARREKLQSETEEHSSS
jgi:hypothetical protein